ncbi:MAG TPA: peptidoglycan editing factor PgeF [Aquella sp.]|nr:peptidoglycan editing factor PgeF [Aquella sp.]
MSTNFITPDWDAPDSVKSLITTRVGGVSTAPYNTFNLGTHVGDELDSVLQNRQILEKHLPGKPFWLNQTHSDNLICLDNALPDTINLHNYDASFTCQKNKVCVVMSADCLPILLTDKKASFVAAVHAGWRGVENNIIGKTIHTSGLQSANILAYIGPAICKNHFEVGQDVFDIFVHQNIDNRDFFSETGDGKFYCDLTAIAKAQLLRLGLLEQNIYFSNMCTYCDKKLFFSHRRDGVTGRIASLIWLS